MPFVYPAINRRAEEPAWSLLLGIFLQFVEPIINGSSFRSSTTLSSYIVFYTVSIICTWGYARDDRRQVAPADKSLSDLAITDRGAGGPLVRRQALAGCVRPCKLQQRRRR